LGIASVILLDTHVWVWWVTQATELPRKVGRFIDARIETEAACVSSISVWEVALLVQRKRLQLTMGVSEWIQKSEALPYIRFVPVDNRIALRSVLLPPPLHPDPADRIIVATAVELGAVLITKDDKLRTYPHVETQW
jgi:PIN domain nuclease of toxin-antitoxin system